MKQANQMGTPSRLGRRLMLRLLTVVALLVMLFTAAPIYITYRRDTAEIENRFRLIETSYLNSVTQHVWVADRDRLATLLEGIVHQRGFVYAAVHVDGALFASAGPRLLEGIVVADSRGLITVFNPAAQRGRRKDTASRV